MKRGIIPSLLHLRFYIKRPAWLFNTLRIFFLAGFYIVLISPGAYATHISGADLSYKWITGSTFEVYLTLYRDCSGIAAPNSVLVNYKSTNCGYNLNVTLNKIPGTGQEITKPCTSSPTNCNGGITAGIQKYEYTASVTLPAQCSDWVFGYSICCRNCAITTLTYSPNNCSGVPATYIEATLNNLIAPDNSSPVFTNVPVSFFCIGQEFHYNHGVYDADGDSLVYSFIDPRSASETNVVFSPGYSASNPITSSPPLSLSANGDIVMKPMALEVGVMAILVEEYRNGNLIGTVVRDMEIWTNPCLNYLPVASGINGTNNFNIVACPGQTLSFTINSSDADASQSVFMDWNYSIPGATFTTTAGQRPVGTFTWTPTAANARNQPYTFFVNVQDDNCPMNGYQTFTYNVYVQPISVSLTSTNTNCASPGNGTATATVSGTSPFQYLWSPTGATTQSINSLFAGAYSVTVTDANGCTATDTVNVIQSSFINASLASSTSPTCNGASNGSIAINAFGGWTPYTYSWSPSGGTTATASGLTAGTYTVVVSDVLSCSKSLTVTITQPSILSVTASGSSVQCNGNMNGFASVTPSGGVAPYTYSWSNGATTSAISGLGAGNYTVVVKDAANCTASAGVTVSQPAALNGSVTSVTGVSCNGASNGAGQINVTGGIAPYSYAWFPSGGTAMAATGLPAGNYSVKVTDAQNCVINIPVNITQPGILNSSISNYGNALCHGDSSGFAVATIAGGTPPFSYAWVPSGENTPSVSGLTAGNYSVNITDANGCTASSSITITQPAMLSLSVASVNNVSCFNATNGSITVSPAGGTSPFSYQWSTPGGAATLASNLSPGNYSVVATDANNCTASVSATVSEPSVLAATTSTSDATCFNGSDGTVSAAASGGTGALQYLWTPGNYSTSAVTGLTAGNYYLKVTDSNGCVFSDTLTINQPPGMTLTTTSNVSKCGGANGSISVAVSGGNPAYTYNWTPGNSSTNSLGNIAAGTYIVTVTDGGGCTSSATATVINQGAPSLAVDSITPVLCAGGNNGAVSIALTGGTGPFTYQWSPNIGASPSVTGLFSGTYTLTVKGKHNCTSMITVDIPEPPTLNIDYQTTAVSCFGQSDGIIALSVSGGKEPYNYSWGNGLIAYDIALGLMAGNYPVTVTDANACPADTEIIVPQPPVLTASVAVLTPVSCFGSSDGSAIVNAAGGTQPYSYNWNTIGATTSVVSNLPAGNYPVVVTDSAGCTAAAGLILNQPSGMVTQITSNFGSCNLPNGSASVNITGGTAPYSYLWNQTGDTTSAVSGLFAGQYTLTTTDANGCHVIDTVDIQNSGMFNANVSSITNVRCSGGQDGSAIIHVSNGKAPYTYTWQPSGGNTPVATNLAAGNYTVTVKDGNNCSMNIPVVVNEPPPILISVNSSHVTCAGQGNGTASVNVTGGTGGYTYKWLPGGMNTPAIGSLDGGNYTVEITDVNNCTATSSFSINEPTPISITTNSTKAGCNLSNGSVGANVTGGTSPYTYQWSPGGMQSATITGISAGAYSITVTDAHNCISTSSAAVSNTTGPTVALVSTSPATCYDGNQGRAEIAINSGVAPFFINWSPSGGSSTIANNLKAGNYTVTVRDSNNCFTSIPLSISQPPKLHSAFNPSPPLCHGGTDGSALSHISGGIAPYTYHWSNGNTTANASGLSQGIYSLVVTDANGCTSTFDAIIDEPTPVEVTLESSSVLCHGRNDGFGAVLPTGGTPGYSFLWSNGTTYSSASNFAAGNYTVTVTDAHGCRKDTSLSISEPPPVSLSITATDISCRESSDGQATVAVTGGIGPYTYLWWPYGGTGTTATNLAYGLYDVLVEDQNHCRSKINVNIGRPAALKLSKWSTDAMCNGSFDGTARVTGTGGTPPLTYFWSNGDTDSTIANVQAGMYTVVLSDAHGCILMDTVSIDQPTPLNLAVQSIPPICIGQSATLTASCTGGTPVYSYTWNNNTHDTVLTVSPATTTTYFVIVQDAHGCISGSATGVVTVHPPLLAVAAGPDTICEGDFATLMAQGSGGDGGPYNYSWDVGPNTETITVAPNSTSTYNVIVTDGCGSPPVPATVTVYVRPAPAVSFIPDLLTGCVPLTVNFSDKSSPGMTEYFWDFGDGNSDTIKDPSHTYIDAGNFTVNHLVKNEHGCSGKSVVPSAVTAYPQPVAGFTKTPDGGGSVYSPVITFYDASSNATSWQWDFGDSSGIANIKNPEHTYKDTGTFVVRLISMSDKGCVDTAYSVVIIREEFAVYIPNAFTPNGDGVNDSFSALGIGVRDYEMLIFDRWGLQIFLSTDIKKGWDGKAQGNDTPCPADVYVYKINVADFQGKMHNYTGRVSLVR